MKLITIIQDGGQTIIINDNDNSDLQEYSKNISSLLEFSNISILHTSNSSTILRPSKILSIHVDKIQEITNINDEKEEPKQEEQIDIITDTDGD
jgi:hypothetical protein